jgi:3',5'-cyclic AMP phosphodiesterase CpdA
VGRPAARSVIWFVVATLWAISDLHTGHTGNKPVTESLHPASPSDWLIVAGDVAERTDDIRWSLNVLRERFAKVIWVPGNHELWTTSKDPAQVFGRARYDYLVEMCDEMGVLTPEHPYPVWTDRAGRRPSCRCSCCTTTRFCPTAR